MASQLGQNLMGERGRKLKIHHIWKKFTEDSFSSLIHIPKLIFLQVSVKDRDSIPTTLMNKDDDGEERNFTLPVTCNMMVFYYPKYKFLKNQPPLSKFLFDEIGKNSDLITNMRSMQSKIVAEGISGAKLSSSLTKLLYFRGRELQSLEGYNMKRNGRRLVYAFIFEHFKVLPCLSRLGQKDIPAIYSTFGRDGLDFELEFCTKNGIMEVDEFKKKIKDIVRSIEKDEKQEIESLTIIISSHGDENGVIFAFDGKFNVDDIWMPLAKCKALNGTPILIFVDACRGVKPVKVFQVPNVGHSSKEGIEKRNCLDEVENNELTEEENDDSNPEMKHILLAMSSTEGSTSHGDGTGSYFIQELCKKIKTQDNAQEILKLLTKVMKVVSSEDGRDQQVTFTTTLLKQFFYVRR